MGTCYIQLTHTMFIKSFSILTYLLITCTASL